MGKAQSRSYDLSSVNSSPQLTNTNSDVREAVKPVDQPVVKPPDKSAVKQSNSCPVKPVSKYKDGKSPWDWAPTSLPDDTPNGNSQNTSPLVAVEETNTLSTEVILTEQHNSTSVVEVISHSEADSDVTEVEVSPSTIEGTVELDNAMSDSDVIEAVVCETGDLQDGVMKEVALGDGKILLVKEGDDIHALGAQCTHYGAPLAKGAYCKGRVRCPWHGACFNVRTGDIEDYPGLDSIHTFDVSVAEGKVKVKGSKAALKTFRRQRNMCKAKEDSTDSVLIIGGGPASVVCAQTLRQEGFTGQVSIATKEEHLPYDRVKLSKAMDVKPAAIALRDEDFYKNADINILTQKEAEAVDTEKKSVQFKDGSTQTYGSLVLATGGSPRVLPIPGIDLGNVRMLRTPADANFIAENAVGKNVVIIGSSFIGMEVAAYLADKAASVSVVDIIKTPFQLVLGDKVGALLKQMHEEHGVKFYLERGIKEFSGEDGHVTEAVLSDDTRLPADLCVLGVGVVPTTDFLKSSGLTMNRGFIPVNEYMETSHPGVYAAGDIVEFPLFTEGNKSVNVQHWQMAHAHGRTAALSIVGKKTEISSVPYFWTVMYSKSVRYTGYGVGYDDIVFHGDVEALKFVAFYTRDDDVVAVASLNFDPLVSQAAELMAKGQKIKKSEIQEKPDTWVDRLCKL
ncbi:apoptosis-inducing factor 3-like isoform X1 [Mizuhopecten yessoensis]|uniref:apoptosis-inducing factor 3-like isoform X1 n=1 Tax=Mizuhopecten yessoensis TaxID=6573 RepID=UPI000B45B2BE|nr:apoptosis-inducing factor 3-like isoform X1 [Mizuhopecten yessoensis]